MTDKSKRSPAGNGSDEVGRTVRAQYDWASTSPSTAVIETVAIAADREPTTVEPLYESVDPDALDALVRSTESAAIEGTVTVSFVFAGQQVNVRGTGEITVRTADSDR